MTSLVRRRRLSQIQLGMVLSLLVLGVGAVLFQKQHLLTSLKPGQVLKADFQRDYRLRPYISKVKVAGVVVGVVTKAEQLPSGAAQISMKLNNGTMNKIGSSPSASIRPATLLGGNYYIDVVPGGDRGSKPHGVIPVARTTYPVELDTVLTTLRAPQRKAIQVVTKGLDQALAAGGTSALQDLTKTAPAPLRDTATVLTALQGTQPQTDLAKLVPGLESTAKELSRRPGELGSTVQHLSTISATLAARAAAVNEALAAAPDTLDSTRQGLADLSSTLDSLDRTAAVAGPSIARLGTFLDHAQPALVSLRPVVASLRPLMTDLRATTAQLVPAVPSSQNVIDDLSGPVIARVKGPILHAVIDRYRDNIAFYQAFAYTMAGMNSTSMTSDPNGHEIDFQPGPGAGTAGQVPGLSSLSGLLQALNSTGTKAGR